MADKLTYKFTLKGVGIDVEREVEEPTARSLMNVLLGGAVALANSAATGAGPGVHGKPARLSLREFLNNHNAKRNPEKIVAIGDYFAVYGAQTDFSREEVLRGFRDARETIPGNFTRDFSWAISIGWIAEDPHNKGRFYVTQAGKTALDVNFSGEIKKKSGFRSGRRKRKSATS